VSIILFIVIEQNIKQEILDSEDDQIDENDFWKLLFKLRKNLRKNSIGSFLKLRDSDTNDFDNKINRVMHLLLEKIVATDQTTSKLFLQKIYMQRLLDSIKKT